MADNSCEEIVKAFVKANPQDLQSYDGSIDAQEFFESVDEGDLLVFLAKLYKLYQK